MSRERQAILSLVAMGRISANEAERLLAASDMRPEIIWALAAIAIVTLVEFHAGAPFAVHGIRSLFGDACSLLHQALSK